METPPDAKSSSAPKRQFPRPASKSASTDDSDSEREPSYRSMSLPFGTSRHSRTSNLDSTSTNRYFSSGSQYESTTSTRKFDDLSQDDPNLPSTFLLSGTCPRETSSRYINESCPIACVYILSSSPSSEACRHLKSLFPEPFQTHVVIRPSYTSSVEEQQSSKLSEQHRILDLAARSEESYPELPTIILKDTSYTHLSASTLRKKIEAGFDLLECDPAEDTRGNWDIFYLCRWLDRCDLYTDPHELVRTYSPCGLQAFVLSPKGRRQLIETGCVSTSLDRHFNTQIEKKNLTAICYRVNLFDYSSSSSSLKNASKLSQCRRPVRKHPQMISPVFYTVVILLFGFVLFGWSWYRAKHSSKMKSCSGQNLEDRS